MRSMRTGFGTFKPLVKRFSLADGSEKASYEFAVAGACNDLAFDGKHNLYASDSFGKIYLLKNGTTTLSVWSSDTLLAPAPTMPGSFGADGVAWDGVSNLYVTHIGAGYIVRIPIDGTTGNAGTVVKITATPAVASPDGLRAIDANTLLVVEGIGAMDKKGAGRLTRLTLSGDTATGISLSNRLDFPSGVTKVGNDYWVSEGQIGKLFDASQGVPNLPFLIRRVPNF